MQKTSTNKLNHMRGKQQFPTKPSAKMNELYASRLGKLDDLTTQRDSMIPNGCVFFSVWDTFPCVLLHFGANIFYSIFPWLHSIFPWFYSMFPLFYSIFPWWFYSIFPWFYSIFSMVLLYFSVVLLDRSIVLLDFSMVVLACSMVLLYLFHGFTLFFHGLH